MSDVDHNPFAPPQSQDVAVSPAGDVNWEALRTTGNGLRLIYISLLLLVLFVIVVFCGMLIIRGGAGPGETWLILAGGIAMLLIGSLSLIGGLMCTTVPPKSGAKGYAIASIILQGLHVLSVVAGAFFGLGVVSGGSILNLLNGVSVILFLLFLRRLARFIQRDDLTRRATRVLVLLMAIGIGGGVVVTISMFFGQFPIAIVAVAAGICALVLFLMYANLINDVGKAIRKPDTTAQDSAGYV